AGEEDGLVGLGTRMGLHVGEAAIEQLLGALDGEGLDLVDILAAAIVAPARIAFGIFIGIDRALRFEDGARDDVLGGDQFDLMLLAAELALDRGSDGRIGLGETGLEEAVAGDLRPRGLPRRSAGCRLLFRRLDFLRNLAGHGPLRAYQRRRAT